MYEHLDPLYEQGVQNTVEEWDLSTKVQSFSVWRGYFYIISVLYLRTTVRQKKWVSKIEKNRVQMWDILEFSSSTLRELSE